MSTCPTAGQLFSEVVSSVAHVLLTRAPSAVRRTRAPFHRTRAPCAGARTPVRAPFTQRAHPVRAPGPPTCADACPEHALRKRMVTGSIPVGGFFACRSVAALCGRRG